MKDTDGRYLWTEKRAPALRLPQRRAQASARRAAGNRARLGDSGQAKVLRRSDSTKARSRGW